MSNPTQNPVLVKEGIERLRRLLPQATEMAEHWEATPGGTGLMEAMLPLMKRSNFESLIVHPAPLGGWYADLVLRHTAPGAGNVVGTPVETPCATREEAEESALRILTMAIRAEKDVAAGKLTPTGPVFSFGSGRFELQPGLLSTIALLRPLNYGGEEGPQAYAERRLEEMVGTLFPAGVSEAAWNRLGGKERRDLMTAIYIAASTGCLAYPFRRPGPVKPPSEPPRGDGYTSQPVAPQATP